jgi:putative periplasmic protein
MGIYVNDSISYYRQFSVSSLLQRAEFPVPSGTKKFTLQFSAEETPNIYGISFETVDGVQVDNVPLRGSSGTDFGAIGDSMWMAINQVLVPRLVLLQFGVNVVPSQLTSYVYYGRQLQAQIERLKRLLPNTAFILIGVSDMGHKEEEVFHSYPNINLVRTAQRKAALASGIAFWDSYAAMGGANSIIRWVNAQPPLATSDYVHFTPRGARFLAELFYTALMDVYQSPESYKPSHSTQD